MREVLKNKGAMKSISLKIKEQDYSDLQTIAEQNGRSVQAQFRLMVSQLLSRQHKKVKTSTT